MEKLLDTVNNIVTKLSGYIDQIFAQFGFYSGKYSKLIVYIVGILALSKMLKINISTGRKR